jgi:protein phosphatase
MSASPVRFSWISAGFTDAGRVRAVNEDALLDRADLGLWAVADGMGGHQAGDLASRLVVEALGSAPAPTFLGRAVTDLRRRLAAVNQRLLTEASSRGEGIIGSTVATLLAVGGHCVLLWAGDSRIYRLRDNRLRQLTRDHSHVGELVEQGVLKREDAEHHPAANVITRAVGADARLVVDTQIQELCGRDRFLLCTDGLTRELSEEEIGELLDGDDLDQAARALVQHACDAGARDNVTVVIVAFTEVTAR